MADDSTVEVRITGNVGDLRASLEIAKAQFRDLQNQASLLARQMQQTGLTGVASLRAELGSLAQSAAEAKARVAGISDELGKVPGAAHGAAFATAGATREFIVLGHEVLTGRWSRIPGSLMVLSERMGNLHGIVGALASGWGAMGVAGVAALGAIGVYAYRAYETTQQLRNIQGELLLTGRSGAGAGNLSGDVDKLAGQFNLSRLQASELVAELAKAHTLNLDQINDWAKIVAVVAAVRNEDPSKVAKEFADKLNEGARGAITLAQSMNVATTEAEQLLAKGDAAGAFAKALEEMKAAIESHGGAWADAKAKFDQYMSALGAYTAGGVPADVGAMELGPAPAEPTREPSAGGTTGAERMRQWLLSHGYSASAAAAIMGNAQIESSFEPNAGLGTAHQGLFQWDSNRWGGAVSSAGGKTPNFEQQMAFMDAELQKLDGNFKISNQSAGELAQRFESLFERSGGQMLNQRVVAAQKYSNDTTEPYGAREARQQAVRQTEQDLRLEEIANRNSLEKQVEAAEAAWEKIKELDGDGSEQEVQAKQRWVQKEAELYDLDTRNMIAALKAKQAATEDAAGKAQIQQQVINTLQARGASPLGGGGANSQELDAARTELANLQREMASRSIESNLRNASAGHRVDADYLKQYQAGIATQVKAGDLTPTQGLGYNQQMISGVSGSEIGQLRSIMGMTGITPDQKSAIEASISEISASAKTQFAELQKEAEEAVRQAAEKFAAPFRDAFNKLGSGLEGALVNALEHKKGQPLGKMLMDQGISSGVHIVGSGLSQAGGSLLGGKEGQGIGDVLGNKLASVLQSSLTKMLPSLATKGADAASQLTTVTAPLEMAITTTGPAAIVMGMTPVLEAQTAQIVAATLAGAANPEIAGNKFAGGGVVGGFAFGGIVHAAAGGWHVPASFGTDTVPAMLTPGEHVLPTNLAKAYEKGADALTGAGASGNPINVHNHFGAFSDAAAIERGMRPTVNKIRSEIRARIPT